MAIINANIATMDPARPKAAALIIKDGRIAAVGSNDEISKMIEGKTEALDLDGKFLMPGFIEGHAHFLKLGEMRMNLDLTKAKSWDEIVEQVRVAAATLRRASGSLDVAGINPNGMLHQAQTSKAIQRTSHCLRRRRTIQFC